MAPPITFKEFMSQKFLLLYNMRAGSSEAGPTGGNDLPLLRFGECKMALKFKTPLEESLQLLVAQMSPCAMSIPKSGVIHVSYRE